MRAMDDERTLVRVTEPLPPVIIDNGPQRRWVAVAWTLAAGVLVTVLVGMAMGVGENQPAPPPSTPTSRTR